MPDKRKGAEREVIPVSLPKAAARQIARAAAKRHKTKGAFLRDAAIEAAERVLAGPIPVAVPHEDEAAVAA